MRDHVFFVPACGLGERVKSRGIKPFLVLADMPKSHALQRVVDMAPGFMRIEIALLASYGCMPMDRSVKVHMFGYHTSGQADTIRQWLELSGYCDRPDTWILLSNCDATIDRYTINQVLRQKDHPEAVFTFAPLDKHDARFSYVTVSPDTGYIDRIAEKTVISSKACAGVYYLNAVRLYAALRPSDAYLSQALGRMENLKAVQCREYHGWNDMDQIEELESGKVQVK